MASRKPVKIKANPYQPSGPIVGSETIDEIVNFINTRTKAQMSKYIETQNVPISARDSILSFIQMWGYLDTTHEEYMRHIPPKFDKMEALRIGDLIYYIITGSNEASKLDDNSDRKVWSDFLKPKMPTGYTIHDATGLHAELLNYLPQNRYNRMTINQLFMDDPALYSQVFEDHFYLTPSQHDILQNIVTIVEKGNIEKFSLTLHHGTRNDRVRLSRKGGMNEILLGAYEAAVKIAQAYKSGDYEEALAYLKDMEREYSIEPDSFMLHMNEMFMLTPTSIDKKQGASRAGVAKKSKNKNRGKQNKGNKGGDSGTYYIKGFQKPLLVSLDRMTLRDTNKLQDTQVEKIINAIRAPPFNNRIAKKGGSNGLFVVPGLGLTTNWYEIFKQMEPTNVYFNEDQQARSSKSLTMRFIIHGDYSTSAGVSDLLPKGTLTVTLRMEKGTKPAYFGKNDERVFAPVVDILVEDRAGDLGFADARQESTKDRRQNTGNALTDAFNEVNTSVNRGDILTNPKGSKRKSRGMSYAIQLIPDSQIRKNTIKEDTKSWLKPTLEEIDGGMLLHKNFATGKKFQRKPGERTWIWNDTEYLTKEDLQTDLNQFGTYIDKGKSEKMVMLYAQRKDNNAMVPYRIHMPRIILQHDMANNTLKAKKGSGYYTATRSLLEAIEGAFGKIKFHRDLKDLGGMQIKKGRTKIRLTQGIGKEFKAEGLETPTGMAFIHHYLPGTQTPVYASRESSGKMKMYQMAGE